MWKGSISTGRRGEILAVVVALEPRARERLGLLAASLGLDEVSTLAWLQQGHARVDGIRGGAAPRGGNQSFFYSLEIPPSWRGAIDQGRWRALPVDLRNNTAGPGVIVPVEADRRLPASTPRNVERPHAVPPREAR